MPDCRDSSLRNETQGVSSDVMGITFLGGHKIEIHQDSVIKYSNMVPRANKTITRLLAEENRPFEDGHRPKGVWSKTFEQMVDSVEGESEECGRRVLVTLDTGEVIDIPACWVEHL